MSAAQVMSATDAPIVKPKVKTRAKQRYLKAKKERRKQRKGLATVPEKAAEEQSYVLPVGVETDEDSEEHEIDRHASEASDHELERGEAAQKENRPKKRRKLNSSDKGDSGPTTPTSTDRSKTEYREVALTVQDYPRGQSPTPKAILPSFSLPSQPDAPSKSVLALQGIDKALVEAEVIDPAQVMGFSSTANANNGTQLSERTRKRLADLGISELFAVQTAVVPFLLSTDRLKSLYLPYDPPNDVCVSAPTGSGKTLAYVLPIVEILSPRIVIRLRTLVVLPTRDLVIQVRETFEAVSKGRGLKIGTATGQHSFAHEQAQLIADKSPGLQGGSSKVDILICTPGRLMDHLNGSPNFSLQHLRFLVIDEADRLLAQSFQDWLAQVLAATRPPLRQEEPDVSPDLLSEQSVPSTDALSPASLHLLRGVPDICTDTDEKRDSSCQKLLFSATLTRDPAKISALNLHNPRYFIVQSRKESAVPEEASVLDLVMEKFTMPAGLTEHMIVCSSSEKPLTLFHLVHNRGVTNALVFTKSAESTTRLVRLFEYFEAARSSEDQSCCNTVARAYSSDLGATERKSLLERFKKQEIDILICSDLISRGIDISHVSHVVSYDAPVDMRKYVHRVGRTARAGRSGHAWTLVEEQEARYFKSMLKTSDHLDKVKRIRVSDKDVVSLRSSYESALDQLKEAYARSAN
ncbi:DEAD-domain-containing protein [Sparassis latifolia]|uniref:ATP-dependent RNA helicase n=1 Tax=Sparassis crispa TaxID=139825 RepID=A0A401H061_9APHY|nr:ATP-dependent RNA helicase dbp6 [Sparassis crispa]GBE87801.1 ATP-dependent RNA helicase dbp6 [Sparassis crispa]